MSLFGRRNKEESKEKFTDLPPLSVLDQIPLTPMEQPQPIKEPEKPTIAPLFVKIDRYRHILSTIGNLKTALMIVKNSLDTLDQIEKARDDTFKIVIDIIGKMDQRLVILDNELLRPAGFREMSEVSPEYQDVRTIEATVAELRGQIEQLKSELGKLI